MKNLGTIDILASQPSEAVGFGNFLIDLTAKAGESAPKEIVWMPKGTNSINARTLNGDGFNGDIICDRTAFDNIKASFDSLKASGQRVYLDENHEDAAATGDIRDFSWDESRGIIAHVDWTPRGEAALRNKDYTSFSPAFRAHPATGRVVSLLKGHAAGGLVNAPAFGAAMPALIAARLGGNPIEKPAPGGNPGTDQTIHPMKDTLLKLLAAFKVTPPADATEADLVALYAKHSGDALASADAATKKLNEEFVSVQAKAKTDADALVLAKRTADEAKSKAEKAESERDVLAAVLKDTPNRAVTTAVPTADVIAGFGKQKGAVDRGIFFRDEVVPVIAKRSTREISRSLAVMLVAAFAKAKSSGLYADVQAANNLGTLVGNLISQQALALLKFKFPILKGITTDFSNASADFNQTIITRLKTAIAASQYAGAGYAAANAGTTDVQVTMNHHPYAQVAFNANETASTNRDLFGEQAEVVAYALGLDMVNAIYALLIQASFPAVAALVLGGTGGGTATGSGTGFARQTSINAAKALFVQKVPEDGRIALLNADAFGALASDPAVVSLAAYQKPDIITGYELPPIAGFSNVQVVNLPTTAGMVAALLHKRALILATRVPNDYTQALPGSNYGNVSQVTDPDTGITFMQTEYVNHDSGAANFRQAVMYGVAVGDPVCAQLVYHS